jgi:hypothetical protein
MGRLRLEGDAYVLDGVPVQPGDLLELLLSGGRSVRVEFVWSGEPEATPVFALLLGGLRLEAAIDPEHPERRPPRRGEGAKAVVRIDGADLADADFRWPLFD